MSISKNSLETSTTYGSGGIARLFGGRFGARICMEPDLGGGAAGAGAGTGEGEEGGSTTDGAGENQGTAAGTGEGTVKPTDREAELLKEVMSRKKKQIALETERDQAHARLKEFDGIDPVAIKALLQSQKDAEKAGLEAKGDFERLKKMMADEHAVELKAVLEQLAEKDKKIAAAFGTIDNLTIGQSFSSSPFVNDELILTPAKARVIYGAHFEVEDDRAVAYDKPKGSSERTKLVDGAGNALPFEAAIKKLVEADPDRERIVKSKLQAGAGSRTTDTRATNAGSVDLSKLTGVARIQASLVAGKAFGKK